MRNNRNINQLRDIEIIPNFSCNPEGSCLIKCGDRLSDVNFEQINGLEFEFGCGKNYSINELANMFGESYPKKYIPARDGEMRETLCESKIERDLLNWEPTHDLETYIKTLIGDSK